MASYHAGETIICWRNTRDEDGTYTAPATSMMISISNPNNEVAVDNQNMRRDSAGKYHYDYNSPATAMRGKYTVTYTATDGTRITKYVDVFIME